MADGSDLQIVMGVLRRLDSSIVQLVDFASHTAQYDFDPETKTWNRVGVEGPLYVVKRSVVPSTQLIITNRKSATNLVESLTATFKIENNPPYLMYKNESGVRGIWFHQREDYDRIAPLCEQIVATIRSEGDRPLRLPEPPQPPPAAFEPPAPAMTSAPMDELIRRLQAPGMSISGSQMLGPAPATPTAPPAPPPRGPAPSEGGPYAPDRVGSVSGAMLLQRLQVSQVSGAPSAAPHEAQGPGVTPQAARPAEGGPGRPDSRPVRVGREHIRRAILQLVGQDEFLDMLADAISRQL